MTQIDLPGTCPWRTMDSAPESGEVLLMVKLRSGIRGCMVVGHQMPGGHCIEGHPEIAPGWYFWNGRMFDLAAEPIAWMPLPMPPAWVDVPDWMRDRYRAAIDAARGEGS